MGAGSRTDRRASAAPWRGSRRRRRLAQEQDAAIIVVTHDEKIFDRFDRIVHLRDGRLESVEDQTPQVAAAAGG
jgi:ABC-type siderophore export system fused ATPase/permease subunit